MNHNQSPTNNPDLITSVPTQEELLAASKETEGGQNSDPYLTEFTQHGQDGEAMQRVSWRQPDGTLVSGLVSGSGSYNDEPYLKVIQFGGDGKPNEGYIPATEAIVPEAKVSAAPVAVEAVPAAAAEPFFDEYPTLTQEEANKLIEQARRAAATPATGRRETDSRGRPLYRPRA